MTTPKFIAKLHDEVLDLHGEVRNFTSLLRVVCAYYLAAPSGLDASRAGVTGHGFRRPPDRLTVGQA